jgi:hypothetical protein
LWQLNIGPRDQKTIRAGSVDFAEKYILPKLYFQPFLGLRMPNMVLSVKKQEIPFME